MKYAVLPALFAAVAAFAAEPPAPFGPVPTARQLAWHKLEYYGFAHFTVNTFTDKEWGYGDESENVFNPTAFDADQIVSACATSGMKGLILTAKHHDGFCLWPSKFTEHSVKNSTWRGGKGDVVREVVDACRRHGLKVGLYLSPWDRNHAEYSRPAYLEYFRKQLRELNTEYGELFEVWFDGANGGDGHYGGARERRNIDNRTYYDWQNTWQIVRDLQPMACMFSDAGPDVRWVGNERGIAGDPCWATQNRDEFMPGRADGKRLNLGDRPGTHWVPAECDVSIRPGWFYHAREDGQVKSPAQLLDLYYKSVGRGGSFLLNVPPDRRGLVHENDAKSLAEFGRLVRSIFAVNLADGAKAVASNVRGGDNRFAAAGAVDGRDETYWTTDDSVTTPELVLELGGTKTFNVVSLREVLPLGQRVDDWALDAWIDGAWVEFAKGSAIGSRRLWRGQDVTTDKVRLRIVKAAACPAISEFALYCEPADARTAGGGAQGPGELARTGWKVHGVSYATPESGVAANAIDGNARTLWHTHGPEGEQAPPQFIALDLGAARTFKGFTYLPRTDGTTRGVVDRYEIFASDDPTAWGQPVAAGEFGNIKANPIRQVVAFARPVTARYVKFVALHSADGNHVTVAELGLLAP